MDRRHHATRAPAGEFDRGQGEREEAGVLLDRGALRRAQDTGRLLTCSTRKTPTATSS